MNILIYFINLENRDFPGSDFHRNTYYSFDFIFIFSLYKRGCCNCYPEPATSEKEIRFVMGFSLPPAPQVRPYAHPEYRELVLDQAAAAPTPATGGPPPASSARPPTVCPTDALDELVCPFLAFHALPIFFFCQLVLIN